MKRLSWMLIFVLLLGIGMAPQAWASSPKDHHPKDSREDAHQAMEAVMKLKHHPQRLEGLSVEKLTWLLRGLDHLSKMPSIDHKALFDLQLKLTLHLLDIQVKRMQHLFKYSYYPWDYKYVSKYHDYGYGYDHDYGYGYDRDYGYAHGKMGGPDKGYMESGYHGGYGYPVMPVKHMHQMKGIMVKKMQFHTARGCHLNQGSATRNHAYHDSIFVGPCQQVGHDAWTFNVWWV